MTTSFRTVGVFATNDALKNRVAAAFPDEIEADIVRCILLDDDPLELILRRKRRFELRFDLKVACWWSAAGSVA